MYCFVMTRMALLPHQTFRKQQLSADNYHSRPTAAVSSSVYTLEVHTDKNGQASYPRYVTSIIMKSTNFIHKYIFCFNLYYIQDDVRWKITCGKTNDQQEMTALAYQCLQMKTPHKNFSTKSPGFKPRQLTFQILNIYFPLLSFLKLNKEFKLPNIILVI